MATQQAIPNDPAGRLASLRPKRGSGEVTAGSLLSPRSIKKKSGQTVTPIIDFGAFGKPIKSYEQPTAVYGKITGYLVKIFKKVALLNVHLGKLKKGEQLNVIVTDDNGKEFPPYTISKDFLPKFNKAFEYAIRSTKTYYQNKKRAPKVSKRSSNSGAFAPAVYSGELVNFFKNVNLGFDIDNRTDLRNNLIITGGANALAGGIDLTGISTQYNVNALFNIYVNRNQLWLGALSNQNLEPGQNPSRSMFSIDQGIQQLLPNTLRAIAAGARTTPFNAQDFDYFTLQKFSTVNKITDDSLKTQTQIDYTRKLPEIEQKPYDQLINDYKNAEMTRLRAEADERAKQPGNVRRRGAGKISVPITPDQYTAFYDQVVATNRAQISNYVPSSQFALRLLLDIESARLDVLKARAKGTA